MPVADQDVILLERLKAGDKDAFTCIYTKYWAGLAEIAMPILKDESEAQDLVQDFFIDFLQKKLFLQIGHPYNVKYFLGVSIRNRCFDRIRRKKVNQKRTKRLLELFETSYFLESRLERSERQHHIGSALQLAMDEIPPQSAKVFALSYIEKKSRNEIAAEMGISPHTVKNQLVRAVKIMRQQLKLLNKEGSPA